MEQQLRKKVGLLEWLEQRQDSPRSHAAVMNRYLEGKARKKGVAFKGVFELTPRCNLDCRMCYVHLTDEQLQSSRERVLSGAEWKHVMQQAINGGMLYALLTGGEAMLHPDFEELFCFLCQLGVRVTVNTNGLLLTKERIAFFKKYMPLEIRISVYGPDEDTYEKVTGRRAFSQVIGNVRAAKEAGLPICLTVTPSRYMKDKLVETVNLVMEVGAFGGINSGLIDPRTETGRAGIEHDISLDEYIHLYMHMRQRDGAVNLVSCEEDIPASGGNDTEEKRGFRCGGGRSSFAVVWHGKMQPCLNFCDFQVDITETPFDEAWKMVNDFVNGYPVPRECFGCPYETFCTVCVIKHSENAPIGHANPELCQRAKRFAKEGLFRLKNNHLEGE